ncbi:hypothetical protein ROJ8625_02107 [Roseivivax jejudonensis]|uniref:Uncharacterized protein n=1 Tax=Roseivivax jejudonensis TaxID=1529041 RepID=A0A1X6Z7X1_9RHOB|nr:hypothetical protein [Roseivivax jejudonensis]SLN42844.1 hypothetical protein ROJ8625_02107 [Roseivivax jejudonensis]
MRGRGALWFAPVAGLVALAAVLGWRQGWIAANVTETEVIAAYAQRYLADRAADGTGAQARASECRAVPAREVGAWLVVICGPDPHDAARHYTYYVARDGGLVRRVGPDDV